jgi:glycosyltransferase involved in cell wall biosynthesis
VTERLPVSLCINTLDAAKQLAGCIESCLEWVSEVVIADMGSSDDTLAVAGAYGARVLPIPRTGIVEPGRQVLIDAAREPWTFVLDADERAHHELPTFVAPWLRATDIAGIYLPRRNYLLGKWLRQSGYWPDYQLRLFRTGSVTWPPHVHARPIVDGVTINAPAVPEAGLIHFSYESIQEWVTRNNLYTSREVDHLDSCAAPLRRHSLVTAPIRYFMRHYVSGRGFRDGAQGLWVACLMAMYGGLVQLKRWERRVKPSNDD